MSKYFVFSCYIILTIFLWCLTLHMVHIGSGAVFAVGATAIFATGWTFISGDVYVRMDKHGNI